jgi:hypothetical protein
MYLCRLQINCDYRKIFILTGVLKCTVNAPWYVLNRDLHSDLGIEPVTDINAKLANSHEERLQDHINIEASTLLRVELVRRCNTK